MATQFTVEAINPDEAGIEFYVTRYKAFRLGALQTDPSCKQQPVQLHCGFDQCGTSVLRARLRRSVVGHSALGRAAGVVVQYST